MPDTARSQNDRTEIFFPEQKQLTATLRQKNIRIHKNRTSIRLEPAMWDALNEIAALEGRSVHDLCSTVHDMKERGASFTAALRVFMMEYYRAAMMAYRKTTDANTTA